MQSKCMIYHSIKSTILPRALDVPCDFIRKFLLINVESIISGLLHNCVLPGDVQMKLTGSGTDCGFLSGLNEYLMEIDVLNEKAILVSNYRIYHLFFLLSSAFFFKSKTMENDYVWRTTAAAAVKQNNNIKKKSQYQRNWNVEQLSTQFYKRTQKKISYAQ